MDFHTCITMRDWTRRVDPEDRPAQDSDQFYQRTLKDAVGMGSAQRFGQTLNERDCEKARRPYYNIWPSIIPMLTRLDLDLDSNLIQLPLPACASAFPETWRRTRSSSTRRVTGSTLTRPVARVKWDGTWAIIEVIPHYRRPHMALVWTGLGRRVPRIAPRKGGVVHGEMVEKLPSVFGGG
jgi:hypothetical protein